ncbi:MAG TPA: glycosyltransferase family 4 protein [Vicinamibacterales bacterium]|nr:glycosyltransferase family 4 protein [Vicinamibacterales bacterium]
MRILLVGDYPRDARLGSTKVALKLQEELQVLGHTCDVLLADDLGSFPRNRFARQALAPLAALAAVGRAVRTNGRYDVIDVASAEGLWLGALRRLGMLSAAVVARSNGLEQLNYQRMLEDHDAGISQKPWTRRVWYPAVRLSQVAAAARWADRMILLNAADREYAVSRGWKPESRIDLVPHGVSSRFLADVPPAGSPRGRGILFCGTWDAMKGIHYLTAAYATLIARGRRVPLTVLGGGVPADTILSAFPAPARACVRVVDRVLEEDVIDAYRSHDLLVLPSSYEGFGMVVLEAMSQRLPVIATPVGCATFLVDHEETGLIVPTRDAIALADAIDRLLDDPGLRTRLAESARARVEGMTWTRTAPLTLDAYARARARS